MGTGSGDRTADRQGYRAGYFTRGGPVTGSGKLELRVPWGGEAWVGSYGGLSYLAPYYGCPSFALYSDRSSAKFEHRTLAMAALATPHLGPCQQL